MSIATAKPAKSLDEIYVGCYVVAELLGCHPTRARRLADSGRIAMRKAEGLPTRYKLSDVLRIKEEFASASA
jgi:hypothetical protein